MKDERLNPKPRHPSLEERLAKDRWMREQIHQIADLREEMIARGCTMDEVEERVVEQIRLLGQELLSGIAREKSEVITDQALEQNPEASHDSKRKKFGHDVWNDRGNRAGAAGEATRVANASFQPSHGRKATWRFKVAARSPH